MNKVVLIGRLTADPEISYTKGDKPFCIARYNLAVPRASKNQGEQDTDFIPCRVRGSKGEFAGKYFKKGLRVAVSGELRIESYKDNGGNTKYSTYVLLSSQEFADGKQNDAEGNDGYAQEQNRGQQGNGSGNNSQGNYQQPPNQPYQNNGYNNGRGARNQNGYNQGGYNQSYNNNGYNQGGYNQGQYNNNNDFN